MRARDAVAAAGLRRPILEEGALLWVANVIAMAAGFLIPLALARLGTQDDYGRFSFATALLATLSIVTLPGLNLAITQGAARGQHGTLRAALRSRARGGLVMAVAVLAIGGGLAVYDDRQTGIALVLAAPLVLPAYALDCASAFLNGLHRFMAMAIVMVTAAAAPAVLIVALLWWDAPIAVVIAGYVLATAAVNMLSLRWALRLVRNDIVDPETIRYGRRLTWISSVGAVQFYLDRLVVGATLGFVELALYSAAKLFQQGLKTTWAAANQLVFPRLAAAKTVAAARGLTLRTLVPLMSAFAIICAVTASLVPPLVTIVLGPAYADSATPARLLILAVLVGVPGAQFEMLFRATSDERRLYTQRVTFAVVNVTAAGIGALSYGTTGAAAGVVAAYAINSVLGFILYTKAE